MVFLFLAIVGSALTLWATVVNPNAHNAPRPIQTWERRVVSGPYKWLRHPMYIGEWLMIVGLAGCAAGVYNALAVGLVAELLLHDWAKRENL